LEFIEILKLLADDNRKKIILSMKKGEICVCELADKLNIEQSLLSHHLKKLKDANLVIERKVGRWVHYSLNKKEFELLEEKYIRIFGVLGIHDKKCGKHPNCSEN
jgi:ArsR family transcriptional regulator, arsenate/arsenite/antimonite-responsive transcriptional repressor